jgi:adhesin transport system outer membrane protein
MNILKSLKYAVSVAALTLMVPAGAHAQTPVGDTDLTLQEAVSKGILTNPEYAIVANDRRAVDEELNQAKALYLPSVDLLADAGFEHTDTPSIDDEDLFRRRASLTLTQMLFDGYSTRSEVRRQRARVLSTSSRVNEVAEFTGLDITEAFLDVLRQRDLLAISRANVQDHLRIMQTIEDGAASGTVTEGDVAQAEARLAQARATEASVRQDLREAESRFRREVGDMPEKLIFPEVPRDSMNTDVEDAVRKALAYSPTLDIFEADIQVARAEYEASGASLYPEIDLEVNGTLGEDVAGQDGTEERATALAVMRWNLYRGGADRARQREFIYRHALAKETRADAARQVEQDVRDTWAGIISANERAQQFLDQAEANEKVVQVYLDQFSLDRRTLLDVLDSQNELFVSRSANVNELYTEIFGMYRLLALQGNLLATLGVKAPREANPDLEGTEHRPIGKFGRQNYSTEPVYQETLYEPVMTEGRPSEASYDTSYTAAEDVQYNEEPMMMDEMPAETYQAPAPQAETYAAPEPETTQRTSTYAPEENNDKKWYWPW